MRRTFRVKLRAQHRHLGSVRAIATANLRWTVAIVHRIRHYGFLAGGTRDQNVAHARQLLEVAASSATDPQDEAAADDGPQSVLATPCPCCGGRMIVIETFEAGCRPRNPPTIRIDTS